MCLRFFVHQGISERVFSGRDGPNADTLYATAFFDAGKEPGVLGIPGSPMCTTPDPIPGRC
jgi:hypothetical protein